MRHCQLVEMVSEQAMQLPILRTCCLYAQCFDTAAAGLGGAAPQAGRCHEQNATPYTYMENTVKLCMPIYYILMLTCRCNPSRLW